MQKRSRGTQPCLALAWRIPGRLELSPYGNRRLASPCISCRSSNGLTAIRTGINHSLPRNTCRHAYGLLVHAACLCLSA